MNRQPFQTPPRSWPHQMMPWLVRWWRPLINRTLRNDQRIVELDIAGEEHVQRALREGAGIMITPNHSFHYDSYVLIEASHRVGRPFHFLSAWQVFAMSKWFEQKVLQWHGCFSINREGSDLAAFKTAVEILKSSQHPLVVFPEGDIYHNNDRVTPFRDGAGAIAMAAAKKGSRPVVCVPAALKCFYLESPASELEALMTRLEESVHWRPRTDLPLPQRIYRFAEALLALKEQEYLGQAQAGDVKQRTRNLSDVVLTRLEQRYQVQDKGRIVPERVKEVRRAVIQAAERDDLTEHQCRALTHDMEDLFLVIQLFSYPGDYVAERPSIERIAETLDKFEEDVLKATYPGIRGTRRAVLRFGEPIPVPSQREGKDSARRWTDVVEARVQGLLDEINSQAAAAQAAAPSPLVENACSP